MTLAAVSESAINQFPLSGNGGSLNGEYVYHATLKQVKDVKSLIFNDLSKMFNLTLQHFEKYIGHNNDYNSDTIHKITNHPGHIIDTNGILSPSALIPFCEFEGNRSAMGVKIDQFDVPVCNSFQPIIFIDQLCYKVDPNKFRISSSSQKYESGLTLYIDTNDDRQTNSRITDFMIYLDTLGKHR